MEPTPIEERLPDPLDPGAPGRDRPAGPPIPEGELTDARIRLEDALDAGAISTWQWDLLGDRLFADRNMAELFSLSPEAAAGGPLASFLPAIHPGDIDRVMGRINDAIAGGDGRYEADYRVVRPDGAHRFVLTRGKILRDGSGRAVQVTGVVIDDTDRVHAAEATRKSEVRLRLATEAAGIGVFEWDMDADSARWENHQLYQIFGQDPADGPISTAEFLARICHADDVARFQAAVEAAAGTGLLAYTGRIRRRDGAARWVEMNGKLIEGSGGSPTRMTGVIVDVTDRKRAQNQSQVLAAIVASSDDAIFSKSLDGTITSWNQAAERIFGYAADEIIGRPISVLAPPDQADPTGRILDMIRKGERVEHFETRRRTKDGRVLELSLTVSPIRDEEGGITGGSEIARDITERKLAEAELKASQDRLALSLAASEFLGTWDYNPIADVVTSDDRFARLYGVDPAAAARGVPIAEFTRAIHPEDLARFGPEMERISREGGDFAEEYRLIQPDGSVRWVVARGQGQLDDAGRVFRFPGVSIDITERKIAEERLRQSESQFRQLADAMPQIVWAARPDGFVDYYNRRWYEYTGMAPGAGGDASWEPTLHPDDLGRVHAAWANSFRTGVPYESESRFARAADGSYRWHLVRALPIRDAQGEIVRWFGTNTDIHDKKQAAAERERLLAEAEAANRMKDEFLATLSHELRTPLNAIVGWAKILRSDRADAEDLEEGLAAIERNSLIQSQLIEDLLDISRIVSGNLKLDVQRLDVAEVIDAALTAVTPAANAKGIRLQKLYDSNVGLVSGDPARLQQVVWNLAANAVKFTPKGGRVQVVLERVNSHIEIRVVDTGIGLDAEFLPHVFDRFRQADSTTTRRHGGLGLGLSIVKHLVEMHGGSIRAESPGAGRGSSFVVALPIFAVRPAPVEAARPLPRPGTRQDAPGRDGQLAGLKVLVVDDEPDARQLIRRVLAGCEAIVSTAGSAQEALDAIDSDRPDVIVSDVGMPDIDGYEFIRRVRARHSGRNLPAAALTAFARAEDRKRAMLAGFQTHITKPIDPSELTAVVASLAWRTGRGE